VMTNAPLTISVVIPTHNRASSLEETLRDLAGQTTHQQFTYEVIVADNNSTDQTQSVVEQLSRDYPVPLTYLFEGKQGRPCALNTGIRQAAGEIIAMTDDDTRLSSTWLSTIYHTFQRYQADGVGGPTTPLWIGSRPHWLSDRLLRQLGIMDHGPSTFRVTDPQASFIGPNCAFRKSLFATLGGFDEDRKIGSSEDTEWFLRVFHAGHTLIYQPAMAIQHKVDTKRWTKQTLARRFFQQGRACAFGLQEGGTGRSLCRVPLWVVRFFLGLHWQALKCWLQGDREEALWHWLRRYFYLGAIVYCFKDWLERRPMQRPRPAILQNAPSASLKT